MKRGMLIVFIGIDGSGKTTQAKLLIEKLRQKNLPVSYVWSRWSPYLLPLINSWKKSMKGDTHDLKHEFNNKIKDGKMKILRNPFYRCLWLIYFFIDYGLQIFLKIRLGLLKKQIIISDRIFYDSLIDQAINLEQKKDWLLNNLKSFWMKLLFPEPDMVIYIDCPPDVAFSRKQDAPINYLEERRKLYLVIAKKYRWNMIDGTESVGNIALQVKDKVYNKLGIK